MSHYPILRIAQGNYTLLSGRPVQWNNLDFSLKHLMMLQIMHEYYSKQISTPVYSQVLIHTTRRTRAMQSENKCQHFDTIAQESNLGSLS